MVRVYSADEILVLSEAEAPCVAVWPCVPMLTLRKRRLCWSSTPA
jgi:hypothetical protein